VSAALCWYRTRLLLAIIQIDPAGVVVFFNCARRYLIVPSAFKKTHHGTATETVTTEQPGQANDIDNNKYDNNKYSSVRRS
jgi:hypothetical protein